MREVKSMADKILAGAALILLSPVMFIAAVGIKFSGKGPVLYKAKRMGKDLKPIIIYKFRTMRVDAGKEGAITAVHDNRVFAWGHILRKMKIDELPQLINVLNGTMSIVGPRPEDVDIVKKYYTDEEKKTLDVLPGLACPGSIFNYTHGALYLQEKEVEESYVKEFLHIKLALDLYYLKHWSLLYDSKIILRTVCAIFAVLLMPKQIPYPFEYKQVFGSEDRKE